MVESVFGTSEGNEFGFYFFLLIRKKLSVAKGRLNYFIFKTGQSSLCSVDKLFRSQTAENTYSSLCF